MPQTIDQFFMNMALELAKKGWGFTSPNPMVGAVVVKEGQVVGTGWHEHVGGPHAEVNAINAAGKKAGGATLYVTLEPCNHQGRTPACTEKILDAGITRVVAAMQDPNPHVAGGGMALLEKNGIEVNLGVEEEKAKRLNEAFVKYIQTGRPFVICKCAATLDGRIATRTGDSRWVTGPSARKHVHLVRHGVDAIMVGIDTVKQDDPSLTARLDDSKSKDPVRIILDTNMSISENAKMFDLDSDASTIVVTGGKIDSDKKAILEEKGATVLVSPVMNDKIDLDSLMVTLGGMEITSLLIEGGSRVIASAFRQGIVDKIMFFYAPRILGGDDGIPICKGPGPELMQRSIAVRDVKVSRFDEDILIEGYI